MGTKKVTYELRGVGVKDAGAALKALRALTREMLGPKCHVVEVKQKDEKDKRTEFTVVMSVSETITTRENPEYCERMEEIKDVLCRELGEPGRDGVEAVPAEVSSFKEND